MDETRNRILDIALDVLGTNPGAGMEEIASAVGVVRRTVYGYFPTRTDLVLTLAQKAVDEVEAVLDEAMTENETPEMVWVGFVARLWPLTDRYRMLLALRRGEHGQAMHALLEPVDTKLAVIVREGQEADTFGRHLPADLLSQVAYGAVFTVADNRSSDPRLDARAATITSLLILGIPGPRAHLLAGAPPKTR